MEQTSFLHHSCGEAGPERLGGAAQNGTPTRKGSQGSRSGSEAVCPPTPQERSPMVELTLASTEGLTCKVKEFAGVCWRSEQSSNRAGASGPVAGAGSRAAGSGLDVVGPSLLLHSLIFTTKSEHV